MRVSTSTPKTSAHTLHDVVTSAARRETYITSGAWGNDTLWHRLNQHARATPDREAIIDELGRRRRTYSQLHGDALRVAGFLVEVGVRPGDVVAVQLPNLYETVVIALGILRTGAVINPMLPIYRSKELRYMLHSGQTRVMFLPDSYRGHDHIGMLGALRTELPKLMSPVVVGIEGSPCAPNGWTRFDSILERALDVSPVGPEPAAAEVSELIFTSGTEADPKAIMHTEQTTNFSVKAAWSSLGMGESDIVWMPSPIGHSTGFNYGVRMAIYNGIKLVLQDQWNAAEAARLIESERCTYTLAATTFASDLVEAARRDRRDLSSMRLFGSGGAPVPPEIVRAAADQGMTVLRLYGSTEVLVGSWNRRESPEGKRVFTDGTAIEGVEIEIWGSGDKPVFDEPGEVYIRGPNTCVGFFNDPGRTAATFHPDGWVKSGDLAVMDRDGYLTVVGRKKEIIIRGGLNVAPREIEELLLCMPGVCAVAVVGVSHERLGEVGCAFIVPKEDADVTLEAMVAYLASTGLARYKFPERLEIIDSIPMTTTGKIQKYRLLERIQSGAPRGDSLGS